MEKLCQSRSSWTFFALIQGLVLIFETVAIFFSHPAAVMMFILHQVCWFRLSGPMERHLALGGKADTEKSLNFRLAWWNYVEDQ